MSEQYTESQKAWAEALVVDDGDHGSLQQAAAMGTGMATGVAGLFIMEPIMRSSETTSEAAPAHEPPLTDNEAISIVGGAATLGAAAVYMGIRKYAINRIGKDRYKALK